MPNPIFKLFLSYLHVNYIKLVIDKISFQYPAWFILFCIICGLCYASVLYYRENKFLEGPLWLKPSLSVARFLSVFLISFLLLSPLIKNQSQDQKDPMIIVAHDASSSVQAGMSAKDLDFLKSGMTDLDKKLSEKYEVNHLYFGENVRTEKSDSFPDKVTDMSLLMNYIEESYADQNLGAIILATDGIYNEGKNPLYENISLSTPLYAIALGDTTKRNDLYVKNVLHNKIAYLGDKFAVQCDIVANNCANKNTRLKVEKINDSGRKVMFDANLSINSSDFFTSQELILDADQVGIVKYIVSVSPVAGEKNTSNNQRTFYVEVLDSRQKILIFANAPHPDMAALVNIITDNKNYDVKTAFAGDKPVNFSEFDLVIFHNLPSSKNDITEALAVINRKKTPRWFIAGTQINQGSFNAIQDVISITGNAALNEDVEPRLSSNFNLYALSDDFLSQMSKYPPLTASFGTYQIKGTANILLNQRIKKVETRYPLMGFADKEDVKSAVLAGEGLWKWKIYDYTTKKNNDNTTEFVNKIIQYLTVKDDKRKFRVNLAKNIYKENENIIFDAQLYNDAYEMINTPDAFLTIKDSKNKEYKFSFSKTNNYYTLDAGLFPEGSYTYSASCNHKGQLITSEGRFTVQSIQLENYDLTARHDLLAGLAKKYNGQLVYPKDIASLFNLITTNKNIKPVIFSNTNTRSIIHFKWIFFLILALLGFEWFMRRYFGSY